MNEVQCWAKSEKKDQHEAYSPQGGEKIHKQKNEITDIIKGYQINSMYGVPKAVGHFRWERPYGFLRAWQASTSTRWTEGGYPGRRGDKGAKLGKI